MFDIPKICKKCAHFIVFYDADGNHVEEAYCRKHLIPPVTTGECSKKRNK